MSLINDALRRKDQEKKKAAAETSEGAPMQAVHPQSQNNPPMLKLILLALIVLVLGLAALLLWKGLETRNELANATAAHVSLPPAPPAPLPVAPTPAVSVAPVAAVPEGTNVAATDASAVTNPAPVVAPPAPPALKLQGIFFRPSDPTAMINGKTVGVGEIASGAKVVKIERQQVTVERDGNREVLTME